MEPFELLMRGAVFALAMAGAASILARHPRSEAARLAAFAVGGIGSFVFSSAPGAIASTGFAVFVFDAWCMATPAVIWLAALVLFKDGFRTGPWHLVAAGSLVIVTFAGDWGRYLLGPMAAWPELSSLMLRAGRVGALAFLAAGCWIAASNWRADLVESRRRARVIFIAAITGVFATLAASDLVFGPAGASPALRVPGQGILLAITFVLLVAVARGALDELLASPPPARGTRAPLVPVRTDVQEGSLAGRVVEAMRARQLWKRERLGIADLAREIGTQEYLLRRAINRHLGYRNFNDFLHDYRLTEAARRLEDAGERHLPVLTIALDCGYGSIGPFNRAFKARFGVTPTQYRHLRGEGLAAPEIGQISR